MMANKEGKKLWHPMVVTTGTVDLEKLSAEIADLYSLSEGNVYNVCKNLIKVMARHPQCTALRSLLKELKQRYPQALIVGYSDLPPHPQAL